MEHGQESQPRVRLNQTELKVKGEGYGWRKSCHSGWMQNYFGQRLEVSGWPEEAEIFLQTLAQNDQSCRIRICSVSTTGDLVSEHFVDPTKDMRTAELLYELSFDREHNIMFDPVPWKNGKRYSTTRLGFKTIVGEHPFDYFPNPAMFWSVGVAAYQFLTLLPEVMDIQDMVELLEPSGLELAWRVESTKQDLLYLPGSLILKPDLPPFTAEVLFDAFSVVEVDGGDWLWTKY